jgi:serine/threonine protein kinase
MTLAPQTCLGHYGIQSLLGAGGMGAVYLALDIEVEARKEYETLRSS